MSSDSSTGELFRIEFGQGGIDAGYLGSGWSRPEKGYRWATGARSEISIEIPRPVDDLVLELEVAPFLLPPHALQQRLRFFICDRLVGRVTIGVANTLRFRIPRSVVEAQGPVCIAIEHPDATPPSDALDGTDDLKLAIKVSRLRVLRVDSADPRLSMSWNGLTTSEVEEVAGISASKLMLKFESLGDNCEWGLVQRRCGAEPLGLLRFSFLEPRHLIPALEADFAGLGEPEQTELFLSIGMRREYMVRDRRYTLEFHTFLYEGEVSAERILPQQLARLKFLRRKFLEDRLSGEKILVLKRNYFLGDDDVRVIHSLLQRRGPNQLLVVRPCDPGHPAGTVEELTDGLFRAYIDEFASYDDAKNLSLEVWLSICVKTFLLSGQEEGKS